MTREQLEVQENLKRILNKLCVEIGERNSSHYAGLQESERYFAELFLQNGYSVRMQSFTFDGVEMHNVIGEILGKERPDEIVVVGAHVDTVKGSRGADDNGTGCSALAEIGRLLKDSIRGRTLRLVIFGNEENQGGGPWELMGSYHYARECHQRGENIVGMISLEMLGVYFDTPGSQEYPAPFSLLYPDVGDYIGFVGYLGARKWVTRCIRSFRDNASFPSEGVAAPAFLRDINRSDHWSFWQFGYPALMITDMSNFRNKLYHTPRDLPGIIDFERFARVTCGIAAMVNELVNK
jgi:Zn-dependent M28 family amino/carboxypeptidase